MNNKKETIESEVVKDCPILFRMRYRPMTETCMCWGFECNEGWHRAIADTCRELEILNNYYYSKYRVRIQADQIKEKFGTLRFYYSIEQDPNIFIQYISNIFEKIYDKLSKTVDYKMTRITVVEPSKYNETVEITKKEYNKEKNNNYTNYSVKKENGKYYKTTIIHSLGKYKFVPTKHKVLWFFENLCYNIKNKLKYSFLKDTANVRNSKITLDRKVNTIIRKLEHECETICENCGKTIGTEWSPTCTTTGWIKYICVDCAEKLDVNYYKNGKLWRGTKKLINDKTTKKKTTND